MHRFFVGEVVAARAISIMLGAKLADMRREGVQDLADRLVAEDNYASTIRNALMPLRAILRRAIARGEVAVNLATGIASPAEAAQLVGALPRHHPRHSEY